MSAYLIVGYRTRAVPGVEEWMPEFRAPAHWKDPEKIGADLDAQRARFLAEAADAPYTGTFEDVFVAHGFQPDNMSVLQWRAREGKEPVSVRVRNFLVREYPHGWGEHDYKPHDPPFRVLGFNPRRFLKILGLECSLPAVNAPLPLKMWYGNVEHRDVAEAVLPHEYDKRLTLPTILRLRRPTGAEDAAKWDARVQDWRGPGHDAEKDCWIAFELAVQLGFFE